MWKPSENFDYAHEFSENWNTKLKSIRITCFVISALMLICGILFMVFPVKSVFVVETIAAVLIIALGVYQICDYFCVPAFLRDPGSLISSILNIVIVILLLCGPMEATVSTFAFLFGFLLMVFGINKIAFANKLSCFGAERYGWVIASGVLNILAAVTFMILPMVSTLVLNYIVAAYLLVGAVALFIDAITMREYKMK